MPSLAELLSPDWFMPHGHCYRWEPGLVFLQVFSNASIGVSYVAIAVTLGLLVRSVRDIPFKLIYLAFGVFIITCGFTHFFDVLTVWKPLYWVDGGVRALTAFASVGTAFLLPPLVPKARALARGARAVHERGMELENVVKELGTLYDRTREVEALKTQFFANVSHELRTPLALILGPTEKLLADPSTSESARDQLLLVRRNARQLLREVDDLLEMSRLEAGRLELDRTPVELSSLVQEALGNFRGLAEDRRIVVRWDGPEALVGQLDAARAQRVVLNLLSNAFKFTPDGGTVRVSLRAVPGPDRAAVLEVADSGPGIPEADRERVFERFRQLDAGATRKAGGVGIGLALARDLARLHGGELAVDRAPEGGARFTFTLPLGPEAGAAGPTGPALPAAARQVADELAVAVAPPSVSGRGESEVLLVEDNPEMARHVADLLAAEHRVRTAPDGAAGLAAAQERPPDLVVTDLMMPQQSGEALVRGLRASEATRHVPVLVLTARADVETRTRLLGSGASDYLVKPFSPEELRVRSRNLVSAKRAADVLRAELASSSSGLESMARELASERRTLRNALDALEVARDKAVAASDAKSAFLNLVSHELRTPLTGVRLQIDRLLRARKRDVPVAPDVLDRLDSTAQRLEERVDTLLDYARMQSGRLALQPQPVVLDSLAQEVLEEFRGQADAKGLRLSLEGGSADPLVTDARLVRLVLVNLVSNAVKYTAEGAVTVRVRRSARGALLEVQDTGRGIPLDEQTRIFEPFVQLEPMSRKHTPGVGLGLAIVRELVDTLRGQVTLESTPGRGSTFRVELSSLEAAPDAQS